VNLCTDFELFHGKFVQNVWLSLICGKRVIIIAVFIVIFFLAFHVLEQNRAFVMALAARFLFVLKMNTFSQFNVKRTCFASNKLSNIILF